MNVETFQWSGDATGNSPVHNGQVKGDLLHVAYYEAGFRVFDISDPANPVEVGMYETWRDPDGDGTFNKSITGIENGAWNVYTDLPSGYVLVSDTRSGLFVFQVISPPPSPPPRHHHHLIHHRLIHPLHHPDLPAAAAAVAHRERRAGASQELGGGRRERRGSC